MMRKLQSRKFILALIGQITGLVILFYPEHGGDIEAAASNIGALLLMALSTMGYIKGEAMIDREQVTQVTTLEINKQRNATELAKLPSPVMALAFILPMLLMGCETSPGGYEITSARGQYDTAQETFIATTRTLVTGREAGAFDDEQWATITVLIVEADGILDDMEAAALAADSTVLNLHLETFRSILRRLVVWSVQVNSEEVNLDPSSRSDPGPGGTVRPGAFHPGSESVGQAARASVPGATQGPAKAPGGERSGLERTPGRWAAGDRQAA